MAEGEHGKARTGRPEKYEVRVLPHLERIRKWAEQGASEKQIAKQLGVAYSTFREYKKKYPALSAVLNEKDTGPLVEELRSALVRKGLGFEYKEKKEYIREDPDTKKKVKYIEITTRYSPPDTTALFGALNIYDKDYVRDRANHELKKQDLDLRRAMAKANNFDLDID